MIGGPDIRTQALSGDRPMGGRFNSDREFRAALLGPRQDLPERGVARKAKFPLEFSDGNREEGAEIHAPSVCSQRIESSQNDGIPAENILPIILGMDIWPQREAFQTRLKAHMDETGKTQSQVAADLGMALSSLRQVLYQPTRKASLETLQKAAGLFGCSVIEFIDDPGAKPGGVDLPKDASPIQRWYFERSIQALGDEDLDDEDRRIIFDDWMREIEKHKAMKRKPVKN